MSEVIVYKINLILEAGKAAPGPKIASVLGPKGVPMPKFCSEFNKFTSEGKHNFDIGDHVTVRIFVRNDKSYYFTVSDSPVVYLLKKAISIAKGSANAGKDFVGKIKRSVIESIAARKMVDMNADSLEGAVKMVIGTAQSMGIEVIEG